MLNYRHHAHSLTDSDSDYYDVNYIPNFSRTSSTSDNSLCTTMNCPNYSNHSDTSQMEHTQGPLEAIGRVVNAIDSPQSTIDGIAKPNFTTTEKSMKVERKSPTLEIEKQSDCGQENENVCRACNRLITDPFLLKISSRPFHENCAVCTICGLALKTKDCQQEKCYERKGKLFCKMHYFNDFSPYQCSGCCRGISPDDMVYKLKMEIVYHVECHKCFQCGKQLVPGEQILVDENNKTVSCVNHSYDSAVQVLSNLNTNVPCQASSFNFPNLFHNTLQLSEHLESQPAAFSTSLLSLATAANSLPTLPMNPPITSLEANTHTCLNSVISHPNSCIGCCTNSRAESNEQHISMNILAAAVAANTFGELNIDCNAQEIIGTNQENTATLASHTPNFDTQLASTFLPPIGESFPIKTASCSSMSDSPPGSISIRLGSSNGSTMNNEDVFAAENLPNEDSKYARRRGPRTTIKQEQLDVLNQIFAATPKPSKHARAKLALDTGLNSIAQPISRDSTPSVGSTSSYSPMDGSQNPQ
ncbi:LIM domain-containing protein [Ditylenchus destructor]|uniref:LIM domain-containing protein n=1 Tax=Ditylenchus destructor TaxID=166010 RepID=A0AAD4RBG4_9BILA|nr:LIM domain-containing protein [Ditylenchus destructor]